MIFPEGDIAGVVQRVTNAFQPLGGYQPRGGDSHRSLLATLIAHGTNLGLAAMSQSVDTPTAEALQGDVSPNRRKFRQDKFSPATIASRSITCPLSRKV